MKKSCIFLFIMSIISLLIFAYSAVSLFTWIDIKQDYNYIREIYSPVSTVKNTSDDDVFMNKYIIFSSVISGITLTLGISGLINSIKKGRLSLVCIVIGGLLSAYMILGVFYSLIKYSELLKYYAPILIFSALYTSGALIAFIHRKAA
ncbi:MAG: hypothetical protein J1E40_10760 [Oscillospiraceae bacterium]|nr:hypothetical protein [Oscillospiraceae bacterium]